MPAALHQIRPATVGDIDDLRQIEREAAVSFVDAGIFEPAQVEAAPRATFEQAIRAHLAWVVELDDRAEGFALASAHGPDLHLHELDVHPRVQGRGLGRALLDHVVARARARGASRVTLTTFADVPWNGPWYARVGFRALPEAQAPAWLVAMRHHERTAGLEVRPRQIMALDLEASLSRRA